jgi:hypothetical protein
MFDVCVSVPDSCLDYDFDYLFTCPLCTTTIDSAGFPDISCQTFITDGTAHAYKKELMTISSDRFPAAKEEQKEFVNGRYMTV